MRQKLKVLSNAQSWKIIQTLRNHTTHMKDIAEETGIPYTTLQKWVHDLADAGLVTLTPETSRKGKYVVNVKVKMFRIVFTTEDIWAAAEQNQ